MRVRTLAGLGALLVTCSWLALPVAARAGSGGNSPYAPPPAPGAVKRLDRALRKYVHELGRASGAYVVDLSTDLPLFASAPTVPRVPASVEKLYTTSVALLEFGPDATLSTELLGVGSTSPAGVFTGTLYLRGGGDPTFGSAAFDQAYYGTGATVQALVTNLVSAEHLTAIHGRIVGDASYLDAYPSTIESDFAFDPYMEGELSGLAFNRGVLDGGSVPVASPGAYAARELGTAFKAAGVALGRHLRYGSGVTPPTAQPLAAVTSPPMAQLIALTNTPSDNFFAEMLTKDLGARFGAGGTTAAGVSVIRRQLSRRFGLGPQFDDGSGLSRYDHTSPRQVVHLLSDMAGNPYFVDSLAISGETGTLQDEMLHTPAVGRCRAKTGTLFDVASLAGYCRAADGHILAFAFLGNDLGDPASGHAIEASMAVTLVKYRG